MPQLSTDLAFKNSSDVLSTSRRLEVFQARERANTKICTFFPRLEDVSKLDDFRGSRVADLIENVKRERFVSVNRFARLPLQSRNFDGFEPSRNYGNCKPSVTRVSIHFAAFQGQSSSR